MNAKDKSAIGKRTAAPNLIEVFSRLNKVPQKGDYSTVLMLEFAREMGGSSACILCSQAVAHEDGVCP